MRSFQSVIFFYLQQLCLAKDTIPLFLMDYDNNLEGLIANRNPFERTNSTIFSQIIEYAAKQCSIILIFIEDQFCAEDISSKDKIGTPYRNLQLNLRQNRVKYYPNIVNPLNELSQSLPQTDKNTFELKKGEPIRIPEGLPYYYIFFNDYQDASRVETLRRHDTIMNGIFEETRRMSTSAVAIYTGKSNPVELMKFDEGGKIKESVAMPYKGVYLASAGALFHFYDMRIKMATRERRGFDEEDVPNVVSELRSVTAPGTELLRTNIEYQGLQIRFSFRLSDQFWTLDNVTLMDGGEDMGTTILGINVPIGKSYYCNEPLIIVNENDKSFISIPEYQIQPFRSSLMDGVVPFQGGGGGGGSGNTFSSAVKCNPYFCIEILTGLFVSGILLSILLVGVSFLFNCGTNTRFDDPLGKTLVISGTD